MADVPKIIIKEETLEILEQLRLLDDDFLTMVFDENIEATELLLNIILERDDMTVIRVEKQEVQKEMKNPVVGGRGVRLDIYAKDSDGKAYDIEVQRNDDGADVHRARFNSAMLDIRMLKEGQKFSEINESYVIFITENDVMGEGLAIYHADRIVRETGKALEDGNHIVYVNGSYNGDDPVGRLVHDFRCNKEDDIYYSELAKQVRFYKETEKGREKMCKAIEEYGERKAEQTRLETLFNDLKTIRKNLNLTVDQAMKAMEISDADRTVLAKRF